MRNKVCVVIVSHKGGNLLLECVSSVLRLTKYQNYRVIVVDDYPNDENLKVAYRRKPKKLKIIFLERHESASYARNLGIEYSILRENAKYIIFLDSDVKVLDGNWMNNLVKIMENYKEIGILAPIIYTPVGNQTFTKRRVQFVDYVPSACMIVRRSVIEKIGGFDPDFWPLGNEDPDFCNRVKLSGYKIAITGVTKVFHQTNIKRRISTYWSFIHTKNYVRYILLNLRKGNFYEIFSLIAIRRNFSDSFRPSNLIFAPDWYRRLVFLPLALLVNLLNIRKILKLRRNRSSFHFLNPMIKISDERKRKI